MDNLHKPEARKWISDIINVNEFRNEWCLASDTFSVVGLDESQILKSSEVPPDLRKQMEEFLGDDPLRCDFEEKVEIADNFTIPEGVELLTLKSQKLDMDRRNTEPSYKLFVYNNCKYLNFPQLKIHGEKSDVTEISNKVQFPDVVLTVQIFRPEKMIHRHQNQHSLRAPIFTVDQDFCVLGTQYLTELRDKISCVSDFSIPGDFSENPDDIEKIPSEKMKSNFFYFSGIFYNDMRDENNSDYSILIRTWAETAAEGIGPFETKKMEDVRFLDLTIRLGYPYVYVHHGNCEHLVVFSDLRMLTNDDNMNRSDYPLMHTLNIKKPVICMVCHMYVSKWVVTKNKRVPCDPFFFCETCFKSFNYDNKGKKIGQFEARKFFDRTLLW